MHLKMGADPEFFLKDKKGNAISAHDVVPGTKAEPYKLSKGAVQADGTAVEINIEPATSGKEFADNIQVVLQQVRDIVPKELHFDFTPTRVYPEKYFLTIPSKAKELGCDPDFRMTAITWHPDAREPMQRNGTVCHAGGHLHFGWTEDADVGNKNHILDCVIMVNACNNWWLDLGAALDSDPERRKYYGMSGVFRPKKYGVEYRTPSNVWLNYPDLWPWMYDMSSYLFGLLCKGQSLRTLPHPQYYHGWDNMKDTLNHYYGYRWRTTNDGAAVGHPILTERMLTKSAKQW